MFEKCIDMRKATISADVVRSTSFEVEDIEKFQKYMKDFFETVPSVSNIDFWGRLVKGDEIEIVCSNINQISRLAFLLKCYVKSYFPVFEVKYANPADDKAIQKKYGIRISVGVGDLRINDPITNIIDGDAIYRSGRGLKDISSLKKNTFIFSSDNSDQDNYVNVVCSLIDSILNNATPRQCEILYYKILGLQENDIAIKLGITQPSVNKISNAISWNVINDALSLLQNIIN